MSGACLVGHRGGAGQVDRQWGRLAEAEAAVGGGQERAVEEEDLGAEMLRPWSCFLRDRCAPVSVDSPRRAHKQQSPDTHAMAEHGKLANGTAAAAAAAANGSSASADGSLAGYSSVEAILQVRAACSRALAPRVRFRLCRPLARAAKNNPSWLTFS